MAKIVKWEGYYMIDDGDTLQLPITNSFTIRKQNKVFDKNPAGDLYQMEVEVYWDDDVDRLVEFITDGGSIPYEDFRQNYYIYDEERGFNVSYGKFLQLVHQYDESIPRKVIQQYHQIRSVCSEYGITIEEL